MLSRTTIRVPACLPGEQIQHQVLFAGDKKDQGEILILTDKAVYWCRRKFLALHDDTVTKRLATGSITRISVSRSSVVLSVIVGAVLFLLGVGMCFAGHLNHGLPWVVGGALLCVAGFRRIVIKIDGAEESYRWRGPLAFGKEWHARQNAQIEKLSQWARSHRIAADIHPE